MIIDLFSNLTGSHNCPWRNHTKFTIFIICIIYITQGQNTQYKHTNKRPNVNSINCRQKRDCNLIKTIAKIWLKSLILITLIGCKKYTKSPQVRHLLIFFLWKKARLCAVHNQTNILCLDRDLFPSIISQVLFCTLAENESWHSPTVLSYCDTHLLKFISNLFSFTF